jgi:hypothetical protein
MWIEEKKIHQDIIYYEIDAVNHLYISTLNINNADYTIYQAREYNKNWLIKIHNKSQVKDEILFYKIMKPYPSLPTDKEIEITELNIKCRPLIVYLVFDPNLQPLNIPEYDGSYIKEQQIITNYFTKEKKRIVENGVVKFKRYEEPSEYAFTKYFAADKYDKEVAKRAKLVETNEKKLEQIKKQVYALNEEYMDIEAELYIEHPSYQKGYSNLLKEEVIRYAQKIIANGSEI